MSLLTGQTIYVDSNAFIYALEAPDLFPGLTKGFIEPFIRGELRVVTSCLTLAEVLIKPLQQGDVRLEGYYRRLIRTSSICSVIPVDERIASKAALTRAQYGLRLPDSIHIATGQATQCDCYLTADSQWAKTGISTVDPAGL